MVQYPSGKKKRVKEEQTRNFMKCDAFPSLSSHTFEGSEKRCGKFHFKCGNFSKYAFRSPAVGFVVQVTEKYFFMSKTGGSGSI